MRNRYLTIVLSNVDLASLWKVIMTEVASILLVCFLRLHLHKRDGGERNAFSQFDSRRSVSHHATDNLRLTMTRGLRTWSCECLVSPGWKATHHLLADWIDFWCKDLRHSSNRLVLCSPAHQNSPKRAAKQTRLTYTKLMNLCGLYLVMWKHLSPLWWNVILLRLHAVLKLGFHSASKEKEEKQTRRNVTNEARREKMALHGQIGSSLSN